MKSYKCGILQFCGSKVEVQFDPNGDDGKFSFRKFENGQIKLGDLKSRHPNVLRSVIIGKKSWGLWLEQYSEGINEWSFTREEILNIFYKHNIKIPESFLKEFDNLIQKKRLKRIEKEIERLENK